jgi:hypothetical protein
MLET